MYCYFNFYLNLHIYNKNIIIINIKFDEFQIILILWNINVLILYKKEVIYLERFIINFYLSIFLGIQN